MFFPVTDCCSYFLHKQTPLNTNDEKCSHLYLHYIHTCFHGYIQKYMFICREKASSYTGNYSIKSTRYILLVNRVSVIQLTE